MFRRRPFACCCEKSVIGKNPDSSSSLFFSLSSLRVCVCVFLRNAFEEEEEEDSLSLSLSLSLLEEEEEEEKLSC